MRKNNHDLDISGQLNAEYVVLQTSSMNINNRLNTGKVDKLTMLLQESDSVTNFRRYLDSINSGHFLDFWFACQGFKNFDKSDSHKLNQLMKVIYRAYIRSESSYAVPLKSNTKKSIVDKLSDRKSFDPSIFDIAQSEIRDILAGEFLVKFYKSEYYSENIIDKGSFSSTNNIPQLFQAISDVPVSSSSSTGYISRKFLGNGSKHIATSRSSDAVIEGSSIKNAAENSVATAQNTGTVTSGCLGANGGSTGSKDRRNLSEIDPQTFAKVLSKKLEEVFVEQTKFDRILRLVKSVPHTESDTDDSHSSAISYLMKCQLYAPRAGTCCSQEGEPTSDTALDQMTKPLTSEVKDDYAQDILDSHCSRIGVDRRRDRFCKRETDLGSTTSYDSGVATSLEQYSCLGVSAHVLDTIFQRNQSASRNITSIDLASDSHRYHHHHHHHHHKNHLDDYPTEKDLLRKNNLSDGSSNFDSGVSSAYEHLGRRLQTKEDKVTNWMTKNTKLTSKTCYNFNDSFLGNFTSGIPPNTPLISTRGLSSLSPGDCCPASHAHMVLPRYCPNKVCSPLPESGAQPGQSITDWLQQQDNCTANMRNNDSLHHNYCFSTVGMVGSELIPRDETGHKDSKSNQTFVQSSPIKDQSNCHQTQKPKPPGPLVIGYYIGNDPVPYRTQIPDAQQITLGQFKSLIAKKGPFRYFFKRYCDEFESGVVHEEITKDDTVLPLWEGKIVAKIEKSE